MTTHDRDTTDPRQGAAPEAGDDTLFWAERDPAIRWRAVLFTVLLLAPLVIFAPGVFVAAALATLASGFLNDRRFLFQLSARELRLRLAALMAVRRVPLAEIAGVSVMNEPETPFLPLRPRSGHLVLKRTDGKTILVPGLLDVAEAAEAVRRLKAEGDPALDHAA